MPNPEFQFGVLPNCVRVNLRFDHGRSSLSFDLELVFLLMPNGKLGADPFSDEQRQPKKDAQENDRPFRKGTSLNEPLGQ